MFGENSARTTPSQSDLASWAVYYGLTSPVLTDPSWTVNDRYDLDGRTPTIVLLAPDMQIVSVDSAVNDADIEAVLPLTFP